MPLLKAWIDPDGVGRGESELLNHKVSNVSMSQVRWVRQSRCLIPLAQMETGSPEELLCGWPHVFSVTYGHTERIQLLGPP